MNLDSINIILTREWRIIAEALEIMPYNEDISDTISYASDSSSSDSEPNYAEIKEDRYTDDLIGVYFSSKHYHDAYTSPMGEFDSYAEYLLQFKYIYSNREKPVIRKCRVPWETVDRTTDAIQEELKRLC